MIFVKSGRHAAATPIPPVETAVACQGAILVRRYVHTLQKPISPIRIALVSDLHNSVFGPAQQELCAAVVGVSPNIIALAGDIFDKCAQEAHAIEALCGLAQIAPSYYVIGNHERHFGHAAEIKAAVRRCGVTVLENACADIPVASGAIRLWGLEDFPENKRGKRDMTRCLFAMRPLADPSAGNILLHHRPERFHMLLPHGFDLMLSGHTHGGQWRVPLAPNGLYAPGQGLFPRYAGGQFQLGCGAVVVCRGLSKKPAWLPRIGNPPELAVVDLLPGDME